MEDRLKAILVELDALLFKIDNVVEDSADYHRYGRLYIDSIAWIRNNLNVDKVIAYARENFLDYGEAIIYSLSMDETIH